MNIQPVTHPENMNALLTYPQTQQSFSSTHQALDDKQNGSLSFEQKNHIADSLSESSQNQKEAIKDNLSTAWDVDLTKAYYQQQQAVLDAYMQTSTGEGSSTEQDVLSFLPDSSLASLTEVYSKLYQLRESQMPNIEPLPVMAGPVTNEAKLLDTMIESNRNQVKAYNDVANPVTSSIVHLSA